MSEGTPREPPITRAYYFNGPWSGNGYSYTGWADYAARNGIGCVPGTAIKGGDSLMYVCQ